MLPEWLNKMLSEAEKLGDWPNGKYPTEAITLRSITMNWYTGSKIRLLQLLINEVVRLRRIHSTLEE